MGCCLGQWWRGFRLKICLPRFVFLLPYINRVYALCIYVPLLHTIYIYITIILITYLKGIRGIIYKSVKYQ